MDKMSKASRLNSLRNQIDAIDVHILDLLKKRSGIVKQVAHVKGKLPVYIRPGREAKMLRVLLRAAGKDLPTGLIHRLWREMIGSFTLLEGKLNVAADETVWDIARDHFGGFTPMTCFPSSQAALQAVFKKKAKVAALPYAEQGWWRALLAKKDAPKIFYRFPFDGLAGNACASCDGIAVGLVEPEKTGQDVTVLGVEWKKENSSAITKALRGLPIPSVKHVLSQEKGENLLSWIELKGFVPAESKALKNWQKRHKDIILRSGVIGAYPVPYSA
jgi:chorismate mutase/prephenate dehydratase